MTKVQTTLCMKPNKEGVYVWCTTCREWCEEYQKGICTCPICQESESIDNIGENIKFKSGS